MLVDIINLRLNSLYSELEKLNNAFSQSELDELELVSIKCEDFLSSMSEDRANIASIDTDDMTDILIKYGNNPYDKKEVAEKFRHIKLVYKGIENGLDISISESQNAFLESYITNVMQVVKNISQTISEKSEAKVKSESELGRLNDSIIDLELLLEKINDVNNNDILDENDFNVFSTVIDDDSIPNEMKMNALIEFRKYNVMRTNKEEKVISKVNIEDVRNCFIEHGFSEKQLRLVDKFKDEIETNSKVDNIRNILNYMESKDILRKFAFSDLLVICIYGTLDSVKNRYETLESKNTLYPVFFDIPSVWINNVSRSSNRIHTRKNNNGSEIANPKSLKYSAHTLSYEDLIKNEKFLKEKGFNVSLNDQTGVIKVFRQSHQRLVGNFDIACKYGLYDGNPESFSISALANISNLEMKLDYFVETGLLGDADSFGDEKGNYGKNHPLTLNKLNLRAFPLLYKMKRDMDPRDYYDMLFSKSRPGCLKNEFTNDMFNYGLLDDEVFNKFMSDNFVDISKYIPNYSVYDDITTTRIDVSKSPMIAELDKKFGVKDNPLVYRIGNNIISRNKVIRNYGKLVSSGIKLDDDALMYSIVGGSYLNMEELTAIANDIGYKLEGEMKL